VEYCEQTEHVWDGFGGCLACTDKMNTERQKMVEKEKLVDPIATASAEAWERVMAMDHTDEENWEPMDRPVKFIPGVAEELRLTLVSKNGDYAPAGEFSNFEISAEFAGINPMELILAQIAIKMTRIKNLHLNDYGPNNESLRDSLMDLAGYGIIAAAFLDSLQADAAEGMYDH